MTYSRGNRPDFPTDPDEWEDVLEITSEISLYQDPNHHLFIDACDVEDMAGVITVQKAKDMIAVLTNFVNKFGGHEDS
ncbi:hypothetical protein ACWDBD_21600 [Streptomyces sp. NPDC001118]